MAVNNHALTDDNLRRALVAIRDDFARSSDPELRSIGDSRKALAQALRNVCVTAGTTDLNDKVRVTEAIRQLPKTERDRLIATLTQTKMDADRAWAIAEETNDGRLKWEAELLKDQLLAASVHSNSSEMENDPRKPVVGVVPHKIAELAANLNQNLGSGIPEDIQGIENVEVSVAAKLANLHDHLNVELLKTPAEDTASALNVLQEHFKDQERQALLDEALQSGDSQAIQQAQLLVSAEKANLTKVRTEILSKGGRQQEDQGGIATLDPEATPNNAAIASNLVQLLSQYTDTFVKLAQNQSAGSTPQNTPEAPASQDPANTVSPQVEGDDSRLNSIEEKLNVVGADAAAQRQHLASQTGFWQTLGATGKEVANVGVAGVQSAGGFAEAVANQAGIPELVNALNFQLSEGTPSVGIKRQRQMAGRSR